MANLPRRTNVVGTTPPNVRRENLAPIYDQKNAQGSIIQSLA